MNKQFWNKKRVLVTGHTGFKGSWLCLWLHKMGAEVTGYSLEPSSKPSLFESAGITKLMHSIIGDVRDFNQLKNVMDECQSEIVIHMAAQPLVRESYNDPIATFSTNVMGTVNVLEAVRHTPGIRSVVVVTSDKCYENKEWFWSYRENEPLGGYDPYSNSKACAELVTSSYRSSFFTEKQSCEQATYVCSVRAGNVIGGGDWSTDRLVPDIIRAFRTNEEVIIRNPMSIRPWQYVLDPLCGYLSVAEKLYQCGFDYSEPWNFGSENYDAKPVQWIVETLSDLWDGDNLWKVDEDANPHEAKYLKLDSSKAQKQLGWSPLISVKEALHLIIEWHQKHDNGEDMYAESIRQINNYERILEQQ